MNGTNARSAVNPIISRITRRSVFAAVLNGGIWYQNEKSYSQVWPG